MFENLKYMKRYLLKSFSPTLVSHLPRFLYPSHEIIPFISFLHIFASDDVQYTVTYTLYSLLETSRIAL